MAPRELRNVSNNYGVCKNGTPIRVNQGISWSMSLKNQNPTFSPQMRGENQSFEGVL